MLCILDERERSHCTCRCTWWMGHTLSIHTLWSGNLRVIDVDLRIYMYIQTGNLRSALPSTIYPALSHLWKACKIMH